MMFHAFDKFTYYCPHCNHKWILESDKMITPELLDAWLFTVKLEHKEFCKEGE